MAISSSRPTSGVRCRCPARRPAPLARTIRYGVIGSGTPFSLMAAALLGNEQSGHLTLHPVSRLWRAAGYEPWFIADLRCYLYAV
jgi:hypothetical protein